MRLGKEQLIGVEIIWIILFIDQYFYLYPVQDNSTMLNNKLRNFYHKHCLGKFDWIDISHESLGNFLLFTIVID